MNYYKLKEKDAVAKSFNCPISFKFSVEMAREVKSMPYEKAIRFLDDVIALKRPMQIKRYNRDVAHRKGKIGEVKSGRFPVKVAKYFKKVLEIAKANADYKGLDSSKKDLIIKGAVVSHGVKRYSYQTQGKRRLRRDQSTNIEIVLTQQGKYIKKEKKIEKPKEVKADEKINEIKVEEKKSVEVKDEKKETKKTTEKKEEKKGKK
jgi:large subunit ribosomal protein L22